MKKTVAKKLIFMGFTFFLMSYQMFLGANIASSQGGTCTDHEGQLFINYTEQEETTWCWVASSLSIIKFNNWKMSSPSEVPHGDRRQCFLYNKGQNTINSSGTGINCCNQERHNRTDHCLSTGWPDDVLKHTEFGYNYRTIGQPLTPVEVRKEICPNGVPGRPFIFSVECPNEGCIPHTYVVKGYQDSTEHTPFKVFVDDHLTGIRAYEHVCGYSQDCERSPQDPNFYTHLGNWIEISPPLSLVDRVPPAIPRNLDVQ